MTKVRTAGLAAALVAALALAGILLTLPPRAAVLPAPPWTAPRTLARGVFHVHTVRSDGTGTVAEIGAAAARAGLDFVILTDHGDGTRPADPPAYHSGVLVIDAVEISTAQGHYGGVGMRPSPYPLGGEARDVVEDVARLGGFGVVMHPDSPNPELRWREPDARFDALEWLNADAEWRGESWWRLARMVVQFPFRGPEALATVFDRPDAVLEGYDEVTRVRPVVLMAGADAHARLAVRGPQDPYSGPTLPGLPSYETSFRTFALRVELGHPLSGVATEDAESVIDALRAGHVLTAIDAMAGPAVVDFVAFRQENRAYEGDRLEGEGPVEFRFRVNGPAASAITLLQNGRAIARAAGNELSHREEQPRGAFRVEVQLPHAGGASAVPWVVTNPIYLGLPEERGRSDQPPAATAASLVLLDPELLRDWHLELERRSSGTFEREAASEARECRWAYRLGPGPGAGQFVAVARTLARGMLATFDSITLVARSAAPIRVSVQVRAPGGRDGERWQRSVYVDGTPRTISVELDDMRPIGPTSSRLPDRRAVDSILLVVDTTNARPGAAGEVWLRDVRLERHGPATQGTVRGGYVRTVSRR